MPASCPHARAHAGRRTERPGERADPAVDVVDGVWQVRSQDLVRQVLREGSTVQAGFNVDTAREGMSGLRPPILYADGEDHRRQRSLIARYFAPTTVSRRYRELMESRADRLVAQTWASLEAGSTVDVSDVSLRYAVEVAAKVIGLTDSDVDGMGRRLERVFTTPAQPARSHTADTGSAAGAAAAGMRAGRVAGRVRAVTASVRASAAVMAFYLHDVRPAIRRRRRTRDEDVISHLLDEGCSDGEIVTECLTYGAAGMVTTREYISVAVWHFLRDADLRAEFLAAEEQARHAILLEILRLEPVVGHLYRRATHDLTLDDGEARHLVPAGAVLALSIRAANADPATVGQDGLALCPGRPLPRGVRPEVMAFGDGAHRCPGNSLALQETDILLTRLLRLPLDLPHDPRVAWLDLIAGYELRRVTVRRAD